MKYCFLILNYKTYEETVNCIRSIENIFGKNSTDDFNVVVVDNHSQDGSVENLKALYYEKNYRILEMEKNLGFSKANNIGYSFIRKNYSDVDFLFVCNSDIEFSQVDFAEKLISTYEENKFDILGPDIFAPTRVHKRHRGHQSPAYPWEYSAWYTKCNIIFQSLGFENTKYKVVKKIFMKCFLCIEVLLIKTLFKNWRLKFKSNTSVQGSCMIFSRNFINKEEYLFYPETNFYYEELILYLRVKKKKYISIYNPEMQVVHWQGRASEKRKAIEKNDQWQRNNLIESGKIYLDILRDMNG
ncbi:MAG: glycosyltransferase [Lachnospiraceae bacterium]|nr:glycosyltransferase [Lachnospiraceae bacterium]